MVARGRHAGPAESAGRVRGLRWLAGAVAACVTGAVVLAMTGSAHAEATSTTATLTLLGVRDSNCTVQTGGNTVYVAPRGTVHFTAELAGISVKTPIGTLPITSAKIASFDDQLVIDGDTAHPHRVNDSKSYVMRDVTGTHAIQWSASAVHVKVPLLGLLGTKLDTIPLDAQHVTGLPAGGKLNWTGKVIASKDTKCGIAEVPGGSVHLGSHTVSVPPATLPPLPNPPTLPKLPGGGNGGGSQHGHGGGKQHSSAPAGLHYTPPPLTIPQRVVPHPHAGAGGGNGVLPPLAPAPTYGGYTAPAPPVSSSAAAPPSAAPGPQTTRPAKTVDVAAKKPLDGAQLPVLLAILAVVALSVVTAVYARRYLLRHRG